MRSRGRKKRGAGTEAASKETETGEDNENREKENKNSKSDENVEKHEKGEMSESRKGGGSNTSSKNNSNNNTNGAAAKNTKDTKPPAASDNDHICIVSGDNVEFHLNVHRLQEESEYFRGLLGSGMRESVCGRVSLPSLSAANLRHLARYLEGGELQGVGGEGDPGDYDKLAEVADVATYLLVEGLVEQVVSVAVSWLRINTYADVTAFLSRDGLLAAAAHAPIRQWVLANASDFLRSPAFLQAPMSEAREILASDDLFVHDEAEVAEAGIRWMEYQEKLAIEKGVEVSMETGEGSREGEGKRKGMETGEGTREGEGKRKGIEMGEGAREGEGTEVQLREESVMSGTDLTELRETRTQTRARKLADLKSGKSTETATDSGLRKAATEIEELCEARASLMDYASLGRCLKLLSPKRHKKLHQAVTDFTASFKSPFAFHRAHRDVVNRCENEYIITVGGFTSPKHGSRQIQIAPIEELIRVVGADSDMGMGMGVETGTGIRVGTGTLMGLETGIGTGRTRTLSRTNSNQGAPHYTTNNIATDSPSTQTRSKTNKITNTSDHPDPKRISVNFRASKEKLPKPLCEHCICALDGDIYVLGGQTRYCTDGKRTTNEAHRFNASTCRWTKLSSMREARSLFYAGVIGRLLYAVSGWVRPQTVTRTVEVYDPNTDRWRYAYRLDHGVHEHAGCVVGGKLYISGGYKGPMNGHLKDLKVFDPQTTQHDLGEWTNLAPMQVCRSYHVMVPVRNEALLVAGGVKYSFQTFALEDLHQVELYDIALNQWTLLDKPLPYVASCMGHLSLGNRLFLFGGHRFGEDVEEKTHDKLQVLDLETMEWTIGGYGTHRVSLFPVTTVKLPKNYAMRFKAVEKVTKSG